MAEVVAQNRYTTESSAQLPRPDFRTFLQPDTTAGGTNVYQNVQNEEYRRLHVPTATGPPDFATTCCQDSNQHHEHSGEISEEMHLINARKPYEMGIVDPLSGFISPAGEVLLNTGRTVMRTMGKAIKEPHTIIPREVHSIRDYPEAIDEIQRGAPGREDPKLYWNSRKVPDAVIRARLGGWTSDYSTRRVRTVPIIDQHKVEDVFPNKKVTVPRELRDELAKKYQWTSNTQSMYEEVHWDRKLPPPLHAPITTFENAKPDPVRKVDEAPTRPQLWQTVAGKAWDRIQERRTYFSTEPVQFTSQTKRGNQIPGYSGCIGGENIEGIDDIAEQFRPFTRVRGEQPKLVDANYKPNIPGYTGNMHNFKTTHVSHSSKDGKPYTTTSAYHRELPMIDQNHPIIPSLAGDFARILTKVPPSNPYNSIHNPVDPNANHSLDHSAHAIVNPKYRNHADYVSVHNNKNAN